MTTATTSSTLDDSAAPHRPQSAGRATPGDRRPADSGATTASGETTEKPHLVIEPKPGWVPLDLPELWRFRDLLWTLAMRDVKVRYKQTVLGAAWVIIQPLMGAAIFTFVFGILAGMEASEGIPYFALSFAGMLGWDVFNNTLNKTSACLVGNQALISKVYFPRLLLPLSTIVTTLVDLAVAMAMMAIILVAFGIAPGWGLLLLPVWMALLFMLALGVGMYTASLMVSYRDVRYVLPVLTQFLLYGSPVGYSLSVALSDKVPQALTVVYLFNPLASLLEAFRWSLLGEGTVQPGWLAYSAAVSVAVFTLGLFAFKRMEKKFADVI